MNSLPRRRVRPIEHKTGDRCRPPRGFTLIEILVVLAIALIVSAMALPVVQSAMANYQLQSAVSSVSGIIQSTRYQAISQGYPFQVVFSSSAGTYQLTSSVSNNGVFTNVGGAVPFGNTSVTLGANATLQFSGGGTVKPIAGTQTLVLTRAGKTGTITVSNYGNVNIVYGP